MEDKRVAVYCRLSVEDMDKAKGDDSESIQNQKLLLMDYALKQGWRIYKVYSDEGVIEKLTQAANFPLKNYLKQRGRNGSLKQCTGFWMYILLRIFTELPNSEHKKI